MPAELVRVCHNGKDALDALDALTSNRSIGDSTSSALGFEFQRRCFTPVTQETVAAMLAA
jgi:hypothetical protein